eukprot:505593_1
MLHHPPNPRLSPEKMKFHVKMHNARKAGKMKEIVEGSWKHNITQSVNVKNVQCSFVAPGQETITLPRAGTVDDLEDGGAFIEMGEKEKITTSMNLEEEDIDSDSDSDEYRPPVKVNWKVKAKQAESYDSAGESAHE